MEKNPLRFDSILKARCPQCHRGPILRGILSIRRRCEDCGYDFHPEPGFYLGAMAVSFILTAMLTVPPTVALKLLGADLLTLILFPFVEFIFVGTFLTVYARVLWLHLEYRMTRKLDG